MKRCIYDERKEELTVKVKRVGGSNGKLTAKIQPNPGSAIQNDFNTEYAPDVIFEAGETEKSVVAAKTKQNTAITGDRVFSIELTEKHRRMQLSDLTVLQESQSKMQMELQR